MKPYTDNEAGVIAMSPFSEFGKNSVLIGANCISDLNEKQIARYNITMIDPYKTHDDMMTASDFCWNTSLDFCGRLGEVLNEIHGVSYSAHYWKILLLPWMSGFVENLYDRYLRLSLIREDYPDAVIEIPKTQVPDTFYKKSRDFLWQPRLHAPNLRMYSFLIKEMGLCSKVRYLDVKMDEPASYNVFLVLKENIRQASKSLYFHSGNSLFLWHSYKSYDIFRLSKELGGIQWGTPHFRDKGFSKKPLDRKRIIFDPAGNEFKDILGRIIQRELPESLLEEFGARRSAVIDFLDKKKIKTLFVSAGLWENDAEKFLMAEFKERGGSIIGLQHGSGYGQYAIALLERVERAICDYFITWGWNDNDACPTIPLPNPYLAKLSEVKVKENRDILFVGSHGPMYMFRYQDYWNPEFVYSKYYAMKSHFFKNLEESVKKRILYKPYPYEYGWNEKDRICAILPNVRFLDLLSASRGMKNCSIAVIDHPGTAVLEAFLMNVPTVLFWDSTQSPMREEARAYFQLLRGAGILYDDAATAAEKVNQISDNPAEWWLSDAVQEARIKFSRQYAYTRKDWLGIWISELNKLGVGHEKQ